MSTWAFFALLGVGTGAMYAAFSMSVIITYRGSGVINFAVGAMAMIPAMVFAELRRSGDLVLPLVLVPRRWSLGEPLGLWSAALLAMAVGLAVSGVVFATVIRALRTAPPVTMLVATVGVTLILQALAVKNFGNVNLRSPGILPDEVIEVFGRPMPVDRFYLLALVVILGSAVVAVYRGTRFGIATRAAFLNEKGAILLGLEPTRLGFYNWLFASALAGTVGIIGSSLGGVSPFNFSLFVVPAFAAALAARLKSVPVAVAAAVAIGAFEAVAVHLVAQRRVPPFFQGGISTLVPFAAIVVALMVVGSRLPNRAAILELRQVPVVITRPRLAVWAVVIAVAAVMLASNDATIRFAAMQTLVVTTLLMSIGLLTGLVGQVSLAQLSLAGICAFLLSRLDTGLGFPLAPVVAVVITVVVGTLVSIPALRVRGVQFAILSFSLAVVVDDLLFRSPVFVGSGGLAEVEAPVVFGIDVGIFGGEGFPSRRFGFLLLAAALLCAALLVGVRSGPLGRRFLAVRANERAAAASGISVARTKVVGAALSSFVAAIAGVMIGYKSTTLTGAGLSAQDGLALLALAYLGGIGSIGGAVVGGILAPSGLFTVAILGGGSSIDQFLLTGVGLVLVAVKFPEGVAGSWTMLLRSRRRALERASPAVESTAEADRPIVFENEPR
jgi:branched-subunit amino acid ABC-type transport system permease component